MTVKQVKDFLNTITDETREVYFYGSNDNPFDDYANIENAFEVSVDAQNSGNYAGVYLKGN